MAKGIYFGVNGVARKCKKMYFGVNGVARKVKKIYIGVNGVARLFYAGVQPGQVIFTSSQTWIVPDGVYTIEVFLVGGGGASGTNRQGSCGGYTKTQTMSVTPGQVVPVAIGAGCPSGTFNYKGGTTSFGILSVEGGDLPAGGSGGGSGDYGSRYPIGGTGGSNGSNGGKAHNQSGDEYTGSLNLGTGQGTTTRAFGEPTGTLYAGGGGGTGIAYGGDSSSYYVGSGKGGAGGGGAGGMYNTYSSSGHEWGEDGKPNTGGGAGGGVNSTASVKSGGSGIAIVRWGAQ